MPLFNYRYNEYKYTILPENLDRIIETLDSLAKGTDPFPIGVVESCYYDSFSMDSLQSCIDGSCSKLKFRLRRYDSKSQAELQIKSKNVFGVGKLKSKLPEWNIYPCWQQAYDIAQGGDSSEIKAISLTHPRLLPVVNVKYVRRRYRFMGCRITVDSQIEGFSCVGLKGSTRSHKLLPHSVLEVKSNAGLPFLPKILNGKVKYSSFSKFAFLTRELCGESLL